MNPANAAELRAALERHGFRFSKSRGQNFLIDPNIPRRIAECSGADEGSFVLEVGPGAGSLTVELARRAARVCAVEVDNAVLPLLRESLEGFGNAEVVSADALKIDLCKLVSERAGGLRPLACANLPYSITSPLLAKFIDTGCFESITVMVQREVAQRLAAAPGTADYGAFTVYVNWHCRLERLFDVPPSCFMPQPKVTSSVIRLTPRSAPPCEVRGRSLHVPLRARGLFPAAQDARQRARERPGHTARRGRRGHRSRRLFPHGAGRDALRPRFRAAFGNTRGITKKA